MKVKRFDILKLKGKSGRISDWLKHHHFPPQLVFLLTGIISTVWFFVRVIPKPSRAAYPCMQVAAPVMSGFVIYLLSLGGIALALRKVKMNLLRARYIAGLSFLLVAFAGMAVALMHGSQDSYAGSLPATGPDDGPNQPAGKAGGINPGRVVWVWNPDATNEKCKTDFDSQDWYFKPENTNPKVVGSMVRNSLNTLTGKTKINESWDQLFRYHNLKKNNQNEGYTKGEKIFIKINQGTSRLGLTSEDKNNGFHYPTTLNPGEEKRKSTFGATETGPWVVLELLRELVNEIGVAQADISVGDPMTDICGHNYEVWFAEFPDVVYTGKFAAIHGRTLVKPTEKDLLFYSDKTKSDKLYDVLENADYLINVANLKPHMSAGISLTAKNHFGSQARTNATHLHYALMIPLSANTSNFGYHRYRVLVDLMGSRYLGQNTVFYLVDGLFGGGSGETKGPVRYFMAPFNNDWSSSIFVSQDQVALESVCFDFLRTEWNGINKHDPSNNASEASPNINGVDDYLHQAADSSNWPAGIIYDPDNSGHPLPSLGTHEHWNNVDKKQYSRNLGLNRGIDLVSIPDKLVEHN
jgi:hypothetical protein